MLITKEVLLKNKITPNELFVLYHLHINLPKALHEVFTEDNQLDEIFSYLESQGFIKKVGTNGIALREKALIMFRTNTNDGGFIEAYRNLFDRKNIGGVIGKKGSRQACISKMHQFMKEHPEYSEDTILKAAQLYIESESRNNNYKYLQRADYIISKQEGSSKIKNSRLEMFCEEVMDGAEPEGQNDSLFTINA